MHVSDRKIYWRDIYFRGPLVVIRLFFVRCVYYTLICYVWLV